MPGLSPLSAIASIRSYAVYQPPTATYDIFAQPLDASGGSLGGPILVSDAAYPDTDGSAGQATLLKNGGFLFIYDSVDPNSPIGGFSSIVQQFGPTGTSGGQVAVIGPNSFFNDITTKTALLDNGGFAILTTNHQPNVAADESLTDVSLLIGTPDGRITGFAVSHFETDGGTPLPMLIQTDPTMTVGPNDSVIISYDRYYTPPNPDFPTDDPTGTQHFSQTYDDGGHLASQRFVDFDGTAQTTSYDLSGQVMAEYTRHPDGAFDTQAYGIIGKTYVDQRASYDSSGHLLSMVRHHADGSLALNETSAADGTLTTTNYDSLHRESSLFVTARDGSGSATAYTYAGSSALADTVDQVSFGAAGIKLFDNMTNADGSHRQDAYAAGVTLTSTAGVNDILVGSTLGDTSFAVGEAAGRDVIAQFKPGTAAGHSILHLDVAAIADFAHLQSHLSHATGGTLITIDPHDTILLQGVSQASLSAADFTF